MITFRTKGSFRHTRRMLEKAEACDFHHVLEKYAIKGVAELMLATPKDSGLTADSWGYKIFEGPGSARIEWTNDNENKGYNIALLIQYGHGTRNGGWVEGRDFINPTIQPIFDEIAQKAWEEVTRS